MRLKRRSSVSVGKMAESFEGRRAPHGWVHACALAAATLTVAGCPAVDNPYRPLPEPSFDEYVQRVQPVVARDCAFVGCHGNLERALSVYAVGFLRAPPTSPGEVLNENELSNAELVWNYDSLRMRLIDETSADDSHLLRKCLDPAQGGIEHADGFVVFESRDDPGFKLMRDWIAGGM